MAFAKPAVRHQRDPSDISLQYTQTATPADGREMEPENSGAPADH
jgi:hypothetical protein